jgi:hypothetical protein
MESIRLRARGTFKSQYGMVRRGEIFWSEPTYAKLMVQKGNADFEPSAMDERPKPIIEPQRNQAVKEAPQGKDPTPEEHPDPPPQVRGEPITNGPAKHAYVSPRAPRSRRRTSTGSGGKLAQ